VKGLITSPQESFKENQEGMRDIKERFSPPLKDFNQFFGKIMNEGTLHLKAKKRRTLAVSLEAVSVGAARRGSTFTSLLLIYKTLDSLKKNKIIFIGKSCLI